MDKYNDFQELPNNYNEQDLRNLFVKRNYSNYIADPDANDILIYDDKSEEFKAGPPQERIKANGLLFPETTDIESAKFELNYLKPLEIEHRYLRKKVEAYLKICEEIIEESKSNLNSTKDSKFTVKSIILAYFYMYKKEIYPIVELRKNPLILKEVHEKLHEKYGFSYSSFKNDWNPIFSTKEGENNRLANPENIRLAIELLKTNYSKHPQIKEAINLANSELSEAERNK
jgi:hypothetical protein